MPKGGEMDGFGDVIREFKQRFSGWQHHKDVGLNFVRPPVALLEKRERAKFIVRQKKLSLVRVRFCADAFSLPFPPRQSLARPVRRKEKMKFKNIGQTVMEQNPGK